MEDLKNIVPQTRFLFCPILWSIGLNKRYVAYLAGSPFSTEPFTGIITWCVDPFSSSKIFCEGSFYGIFLRSFNSRLHRESSVAVSSWRRTQLIFKNLSSICIPWSYLKKRVFLRISFTVVFLKAFNYCPLRNDFTVIWVFDKSYHIVYRSF